MINNVFIPEFLGTMLLIILGVGVVANVSLERSKGKGAGALTIYFGWGLGVFVGVYAAYRSGGYLNPAVVFAKIASGASYFVAPSTTPDALGVVNTGISVNLANTLVYIIAEVLGAIVGAIIVWLVYKKHYDETKDPDVILGTFATTSAIESTLYACITEGVGTFILCYWVLVSGGTQAAVGPLAVALVVVAIGICLGGPTGYAINPARDLGPRIVHSILPIKHKGTSRWDYSWIPIVAPIVGGVVAGLLAKVVGLP
jgi:glycerol uptake facilitator protein